MTRRELRRVACLIAASQIDYFMCTGSYMDDSLSDKDCERLLDELELLRAQLDARGRRQEEGAILSVREAVRIAGLTPLPEGDETI